MKLMNPPNVRKNFMTYLLNLLLNNINHNLFNSLKDHLIDDLSFECDHRFFF